MWSNNKYIFAKNEIIRNFVVLNRRFTEDEKEQFIFNKDLQKKGRKKYVYNPFLFDTEEEYKEYYDRMNSGEAILSHASHKQIQQENQEKIDKHEILVYERPPIEDFIQHTDRKLGIRRFQVLKKEFIL